jgi:hypothetical protein
MGNLGEDLGMLWFREFPRIFLGDNGIVGKSVIEDFADNRLGRLQSLREGPFPSLVDKACSKKILLRNAYHRRGSQVKPEVEEKKVLRCCS